MKRDAKTDPGRKSVRNGPVYLVAVLFVGAAMFFMLDRKTIVEGEIFASSDGIAILGYDTVAYFTDKKAVRGTPEYTHRWKDAVWHFASADNRDLFANNPEKYAPQFGGY